MRRMLLLVGVAALAATMPALAQDQGRGGGRGQGHGAEVANKSGGQGRAERGRGRERQARAEQPGRGKGGDRGRARRAERQDGRDRRVERAIGQERRAAAEARRGRPDRADQVDPVEARRLARRDDRRDWRGWAERSLVRRDRLVGDRFDLRAVRRRGVAVGPTGCPPGLARQNAWCMPPGQLRKARFIGQRLPLAALPYNVPARYRYRFADDGRIFYRYQDGAVFGFDRSSGLVSRVVPLVSTGLFPGEPLPLGYDVYNVPFAYREAYPDSDDYLYRYDGDAIYRADAESGLVEGIVAMLTGAGGLGGLGVGDRLPSGYDVYNLPIDYRDTYHDSEEAMYRYADGSIYRVDPQTRLIESVISMLG